MVRAAIQGPRAKGPRGARWLHQKHRGLYRGTLHVRFATYGSLHVHVLFLHGKVHVLLALLSTFNPLHLFSAEAFIASISLSSRGVTKLKMSSGYGSLFLLLALISALFSAEAFIASTSLSSRGVTKLKMSSGPEIEVVSNPTKEWLDSKGGT